MAVNKVVYGSMTLVDLTTDTVTADTLAVGITAHDKAGNAITGTMTGENLDEVITEQDDIIAAIQVALEGKAGVQAYVEYNILYLPQSKVSGGVLEV